MYKISFVPEGVPELDDQPYKEVLGEEALQDYLIQLQPATVALDKRAARAEKGVAAVNGSGHLSMENTVLTDEQFQVFGDA